MVLAVLGAMSVGPLQTLIAATERVDALAASRDALRAEVDRLEERRAELHEPEQLEIIARSELGMAKPGEEPYVVVRPDEDLEQISPGSRPAAARGQEPWYRRLGRALGLLE